MSTGLSQLVISGDVLKSYARAGSSRIDWRAIFLEGIDVSTNNETGDGSYRILNSGVDALRLGQHLVWSFITVVNGRIYFGHPPGDEKRDWDHRLWSLTEDFTPPLGSIFAVSQAKDNVPDLTLEIEAFSTELARVIREYKIATDLSKYNALISDRLRDLLTEMIAIDFVLEIEKYWLNIMASLCCHFLDQPVRSREFAEHSLRYTGNDTSLANLTRRIISYVEPRKCVRRVKGKKRLLLICSHMGTGRDEIAANNLVRNCRNVDFPSIDIEIWEMWNIKDRDDFELRLAGIKSDILVISAHGNEEGVAVLTKDLYDSKSGKLTRDTFPRLRQQHLSNEKNSDYEPEIAFYFQCSAQSFYESGDSTWEHPFIYLKDIGKHIDGNHILFGFLDAFECGYSIEDCYDSARLHYLIFGITIDQVIMEHPKKIEWKRIRKSMGLLTFVAGLVLAVLFVLTLFPKLLEMDQVIANWMAAGLVVGCTANLALSHSGPIYTLSSTQASQHLLWSFVGFTLVILFLHINEQDELLEDLKPVKPPQQRDYWSGFIFFGYVVAITAFPESVISAIAKGLKAIERLVQGILKQ